MLKIYEGLPAYLGGKRRLASKIMSFARGRTFADVFMGAGSIALTAKALGFKVYANDLAKRCEPIGKGILENDHIKLTREDIAILLKPAPNAPRYWRDRKVTFPSVAEVCDLTFYNANDFSGVKKQLAYAATVHYLMLSSPFGSLTSKAILRDLTSQRIGRYGDHRAVGRNWMHGFRPLSVFEHACNQTNYAVFQGAAPAVFSMKDAFEFMNTIEADTVYLDPPYYGATTYQSKYQALEDWFGEKSDPRCEAFNSNNLFEELVKASKRFHTIIISYGGSVTKKETLETTRKYRKDAKLIPLRHVYSCGVRPKKAGPVGNEILIACTGE